MMLLVFSVLFICALNSLFYFYPNKFMTWLLSLFRKRNPPPVGPPRKKKGMVVDKAELQMVFGTFDRNGDGFITKKELEDSLRNLGLFCSDQSLTDMIQRFDSNGDGLIDLNEFCQLYESMGREETASSGGGGGEEDEELDDLKEAFDVFDENHDGLITVDELAMVLSSLGLNKGLGLDDCRKMISSVDMDGDGMVNFEEFKRMMASGTLIPLS